MYDTIKNEIISALKEKNTLKVQTLREIKGSVDLEHINKKVDITDELVIDILSRGIKTRKESIQEFEKGNRLDLIDKTVNSKSFSELMSTNSDNDTNIALYYYESHVIKTNNIPTKLSKELEEYVVLEYQKILKSEIENQIKKKKVDDIYVSISDYRGFNNLKLTDDELDFVTSSNSKEIVYYIKDNLDEKVDLNKPYVSIDCYIGENIFPFYTNNVDKLENLISKLSDKISFDSLEEADVDE